MNSMDWLVVRDFIVACALLVFAVLAVGTIIACELRKQSRRGVVVFILCAAIATGAAQKRASQEGDGILRCLASSFFLTRGEPSGLPDPDPIYSNPVRFTSFSHSEVSTTVSVAWSRGWAPEDRFHFVNLYGTYDLASCCWVDAGRKRIADWGGVTNLSVALDWPTVFSNAIASGTFPTNATLSSCFVSVFPELDTDGDGLYDGDELRIYGTRWNRRDSDDDGIEDSDELFEVGSDPMDPDTDNDGMSDGWEWYCGLDPNDPSDALDDSDEDGLANFEEAVLKTRADLYDTDGDCLSDYEEVRRYGTNPCLADTDGDGMEDGEEIRLGFDPCFAGEYHGPDRPDGYNPDAYYTIYVTADDPMTWVMFEGDGESDLADPSFCIRSNETVCVSLLLGKTYRVFATNSVVRVCGCNSSVSVVTNTPGDLTIVNPVTVAVLPEYSRMTLRAGSFGGEGSFRMGVHPNVGGVFDWTNSCCSITSSGNRFWFACGGRCSCSGCFAVGRLVYEGYALPCVGGICGCPHADDDLLTEVDDQPHVASVSIGFSEHAVIFEDVYTNAPGEVVGRHSTSTTLSCVAHGGPRGARLSLSLIGGEKLVSTEGPAFSSSAQLIPPGQKLNFSIEYEGVLPSATADDIVATALLVEEETNARFAVSNKMTSVQLMIEPIVERSGARNRHKMGVREEFFMRTEPVTAMSVFCSSSWEELLNGHFRCPISSSVGVFRVSVRGAMYSPHFVVVEPVGIVCSSGFNRSEDGYIAMELEPYVAPLEVCFSGIQVMEVPTMEIGPSGYFTNSVFSSVWYHTTQRGAGTWYRPGRDNFFFRDTPSFAEYCPPPITSGTIDWLIPIAWGEDIAEDLSGIVGTLDCFYHQVFTLDDMGGLRIDKFGQWIKCSASGVVTHSPGIK